MRRLVRDDPEHPDPGFAELYASLEDAADPEPWLGWCRAAAGPVLYLGVGAGRLAVPLAASGIELVGVDAHPAMLHHLRARLPGVELVRARIEDLRLGRTFPLVMGPSGVLDTPERLAAAARHALGRVALELVNPHWLLAGGHDGVRIVRLAGERAEIEVDYPGGWTQRAEVSLRWPEDVHGLLAAAGLELELMRGPDPDGDLAESPTYLVLARVRGGPGPGAGHRRRQRLGPPLDRQRRRTGGPGAPPDSRRGSGGALGSSASGCQCSSRIPPGSPGPARWPCRSRLRLGILSRLGP